MEQWYNLTEQERIEKVYSNYTIKDFLEWWLFKENNIIEIRIKDFNKIKFLSQQYKLPYSSSGLYLNNPDMLKQIIKETRDVTSWCSVNTKKINWNKWGSKSFTGDDYHIDCITHLFIDIDRVIKIGPANSKDLENANKLSDLILEKLAIHNWNKNYCKICSGNGVQLLIKLDVPIKLPNVEYNNTVKIYNDNEEFNNIRHIISEGIGRDILKFSKHYKNELGVEVDKACFNIGRVCALPFTKNFKYDSFTWRGIVELKEGINEGFTDYIMSKLDNIKIYKSKNVFVGSKSIHEKNKIKIGKLGDNPIIKLMLNNNLKFGNINNTLWFSVKCLIRDSKYDINCEEFKVIHKELEKKYKGNFTLNLPEKRFIFSEDVINSYCIQNLIKPLYDVYSNKTKKLDMKLDTFKWEDIKNLLTETKILYGETINEDIYNFKKTLIEGEFSNQTKYANFLSGFIVKYNEPVTKYYFDYIFYRMISYE